MHLYSPSTNKRILAALLLFSQTLMSCNSLILPDKKAIKTIEPKVNEQDSEIDESTLKIPEAISPATDAEPVLSLSSPTPISEHQELGCVIN